VAHGLWPRRREAAQVHPAKAEQPLPIRVLLLRPAKARAQLRERRPRGRALLHRIRLRTPIPSREPRHPELRTIRPQLPRTRLPNRDRRMRHRVRRTHPARLRTARIRRTHRQQPFPLRQILRTQVRPRTPALRRRAACPLPGHKPEPPRTAEKPPLGGFFLFSPRLTSGRDANHSRSVPEAR